MGALRLQDESTTLPAFSLAWSELQNPLPVRLVRSTYRLRNGMLGTAAPPWLYTGPTDRPFDFSASVRQLCVDIAARCDAFRHVDVSRLLFAITQARSHRLHGLQARVTPLRFRNGRLIHQRQGIAYQVQRYFVEAREMLYLVTFCLPRFLDQSFDDKFITIFHELYHISPAFDGDLRRHKGRCTLHTHSQRVYDEHMAHLVREYLATHPDPALHAFLRLNFAQLSERHGGVMGVMVPRPQVIPITSVSYPFAGARS